MFDTSYGIPFAGLKKYLFDINIRENKIPSH